MQQDGTDWPALWFAQDPVARLVVRRDLSVLALNSHAGELLDANGPLALREGMLVPRDRRCAAELAALLAFAGPKARLGLVGAAGGAALLVDVQALTSEADGPVALALRDPGGVVEIECADLEPMFGVTPGERQVIVQLVKGYSSREIADQFGKSILTVRTHVKRAYGKIGVKTRGQLFAKLLPYLSIR
ncbi:MAG TPA: helix-turn-helix transcriptional regulator [Caulobacteraceae bacterium]|jgi:DNA-binding CsgD family transcriptional regulator